MSSARQKSEAQRGVRSKTSPLPDPANATRGVAEANALDAELLQSMMDSLKADIFGKIDSLSSSLRSEITSVRKEVKESIGPLQAKVEQHGQTVLELERAATDHSGRITELEATGKRISIFADYTSTVAKKRAAFGTVKRQLHSCPGIKFGLLYPAVLRITLPSGDTHRFEDPTAANDFVNTKLKKAVTPSAV
ncbi:hypothetical protein KUCAC02_000437 [Chaenocephalus aceratus]|uniref:Uncharacterized protein n=1 Tax=Chaenocephalus aceratus TaxID=36190 RepID=A0ACB9W5V4_CHAAC|nr:hypothetical protein KUCAC02_000437 [Chaenocephalus aceratus]